MLKMHLIAMRKRQMLTSQLGKRVGAHTLLVRAEHVPAYLADGGRRAAGLHGHPSRERRGGGSGWVLGEERRR
jgi:hypothetical protein